MTRQEGILWWVDVDKSLDTVLDLDRNFSPHTFRHCGLSVVGLVLLFLGVGPLVIGLRRPSICYPKMQR